MTATRSQRSPQGHYIVAMTPRNETELNPNPYQLENCMNPFQASVIHSLSSYDRVPQRCLRSNVPGLHHSMGDLSHQRSAGCTPIPCHIREPDDTIHSNSMPGNPRKKDSRCQPRSFKCKWQDCSYGRQFSSLPTVWRHIQSIHISPSEYNCPECGKTFGLGRGDKLGNHMKVAHPK